ncbi:SMI1/KNR4 family protein [Pedobacter cryoconitis]|uniref:SMI1/KNR4 family protein n=1 Tax=Pedobacter cryoconitis TaxID=188932 RepID=UPI00160D0C04|nr:SMI1/KNR4 family protein [Pedobacter cryoconitis]MBB5643747.1 hypothetical protein [Pedobacter cryoconitis]
MLVKKDVEELFGVFEGRKIRVSENETGVNDSYYERYILGYEGIEITPDIKLFSYEEALVENRYIAENYPDLHLNVWMIGESGQGDGWFLNRESGLVLFFDHDRGEYETMADLLDFKLNFSEFIQCAFLLQELESLLDEGKNSEELEGPVKRGMDSINPLIFALYPYELF